MKKRYSLPLRAKGQLIALCLGAVVALSLGLCSCKAQRVIITNATYVQQDDSTKVTTTITTKTTEEYTGVKKN